MNAYGRVVVAGTLEAIPCHHCMVAYGEIDAKNWIMASAYPFKWLNKRTLTH